MTKKLVLVALCLICSLACMNGQIISQYIETNSGTTPKGIEIWNNTAGALDFSVNTLEILKGTNGGTPSPDVTITSGLLAAGEVMVIGTTDMGTYLVGQGLGAVMFVDEGFTFNGDDALVVQLNGVTIDAFGTPGQDPGSSWDGNGVSTANQNIELKNGITTGAPLGFADPSTRFDTVTTDPAGTNGMAGFGLAPSSGGVCTPPSSPAYNLGYIAVSNNSIDLNWSRGNGDSVLVVAREIASPGIPPANGTRYAASSGFGSGDDLGGGNFAVYTGTGNSVTVSGLSPATEYEFSVYEFTTTDVCYTAAVSNDTITDCATPDEVSNVGSLPDSAMATISWSNGSCLDTVMLIANPNSSVTTTPSQTSYSGDTVFGNGDNPTGSEYVVYSGVGNSVTVTNLTNGTPYYFKIFQRKGGNWSAGVEVMLTPSALVSAKDAWINEFHYDNDGADVDEWVEIVVKDTATYALVDFSIQLYNGSDGGTYGSSVTIADTLLNRNSNDSGFSVVAYAPSSSLQNGSPDGLALIYNDSLVVQFLSYEGLILATDGPAIGMTSEDIGIAQNGSGPIGTSLQLTGSGTQYTDFTWAVDVDTTWGNINKGQYFGEIVSYEFNGSWFPSDPSGVSTAVDTINIVSGDVSLTSPTTVNKLSIAAGATLDLGGNVLSVMDTAFLHADASGYAQVIGEINGTTYWESYIESTTPRWFNMAVPINVKLSDLQFTNGGFLQTTGNSATTNVYFYNANAVGTGDPEGDWEMAADLSAGADSTGYSVFLGSPHFGNLPMTISAAGNLINGNVDLGITPQAALPGADGWGWNFVCNPYPSTLDWDGVAGNPANSAISTIYWIFNDEQEQWVAYNSASGLLPPPTGSGGGANAATGQYIAPGQAFFIQSVSTSQSTLHFENEDRVLDQSPVKQKQLSAIPNSITIWVTEGTNHRSDFTWIGFEQGSTDDWDDRREGVKRFNNIDKFPALYFPAYGKDFVYNFVSDDFSSRQIPLSFKFGQSSLMTIESIPDYLEPAWSVILEDKLINTFTDLRETNYSFQHDPLNVPDRFVLHINKAGVDLREFRVSGIFAYTREERLYVHIGASPPEKYRIEVSDISGRLISRRRAEGEVNILKTGAYAKGVYILKVYDVEKTVHSQKIPVR